MLELVEAMRLSPSCNNNQPWRVVVCEGGALEGLRASLSRGNAWARRAPLAFAVCARPEDDCRLSDRRDYFLFGCGLAVGQMLLRATELGLVAHPIAGYDPQAAKKALAVPEDHVLIALVMIARPGADASLLSEKQLMAERERPARMPRGQNFFMGTWGSALE
jgi:nitroreductase